LHSGFSGGLRFRGFVISRRCARQQLRCCVAFPIHLLTLPPLDHPLLTSADFPKDVQCRGNIPLRDGALDAPTVMNTEKCSTVMK